MRDLRNSTPPALGLFTYYTLLNESELLQPGAAPAPPHVHPAQLRPQQQHHDSLASHCPGGGVGRLFHRVV